VLLDEIEKAHNDVFNILLQVLDDGRLTDNHGHTVDFTNTIIVMTSNIGSQLIQQIAEEGGTAQDMQQAIDQSLQQRFLPELLNRIDEKIVFEPLKRTEIRKIVDLQVAHLASRLVAQNIELTVTDAARDELAAQGYDVRYGARPLKRLIQQKIENPLATELLKADFTQPAAITIDCVHGEFSFERSEPVQVEPVT
jgi:ATP-dependent Clp protease ATP-binding subunit ClpB